GDLLESANLNGIYVPALGEQDLNGDGVMDVYFYQGERPSSSTPGIAFVNVSSSNGVGQLKLSNGTSGEVIWNPGQREWADRKYLYPIPLTDIERNPDLGQNEGWK